MLFQGQTVWLISLNFRKRFFGKAEGAFISLASVSFFFFPTYKGMVDPTQAIVSFWKRNFPFASKSESFGRSANKTRAIREMASTNSHFFVSIKQNSQVWKNSTFAIRHYFSHISRCVITSAYSILRAKYKVQNTLFSFCRKCNFTFLQSITYVRGKRQSPL